MSRTPVVEAALVGALIVSSCGPTNRQGAEQPSRFSVTVGTPHVAGGEIERIEVTPGQMIELPTVVDPASITAIYVRTTDGRNLFLAVNQVRMLASGRLGLPIPTDVREGSVTVYVGRRGSIIVPFLVRGV